MATATATPSESPRSSTSRNVGLMKVAMPYLVAIGAQLLMFLLFLRQLTSKTHYQTVWLALIATAAIVYLRWPREEKLPYRESVASNIFLGLGLMMGIGSVVFVNTWFLCSQRDAADYQPPVESCRQRPKSQPLDCCTSAICVSTAPIPLGHNSDHHATASKCLDDKSFCLICLG